MKNLIPHALATCQRITTRTVVALFLAQDTLPLHAAEGAGPRAARHATGRLSWYTLLANPKQYDGEVITLSAVLLCGNDDAILYPNQEDANCRRYENQIRVTCSDAKRLAALMKLPRMSLVITGRFSTKPFMKDDPSVEYYFDFWCVEEFATDSPFHLLYTAALCAPGAEEIRNTQEEDLWDFLSMSEPYLSDLRSEEGQDPAVAKFLSTLPKQKPGSRMYILRTIQCIDAQIARLLGPKGASMSDLGTLYCHPTRGAGTGTRDRVDPFKSSQETPNPRPPAKPTPPIKADK